MKEKGKSVLLINVNLRFRLKLKYEMNDNIDQRNQMMVFHICMGQLDKKLVKCINTNHFSQKRISSTFFVSFLGLVYTPWLLPNTKF